MELRGTHPRLREFGRLSVTSRKLTSKKLKNLILARPGAQFSRLQEASKRVPNALKTIFKT
jgi:hypothetical protein